MTNKHWFALACAAVMGCAGCGDSSDKAGASDLAKDVQSIPMNNKGNAALGGNNAPAENSPATPSQPTGGQAAPQQGTTPAAPGTQAPAPAGGQGSPQATTPPAVPTLPAPTPPAAPAAPAAGANADCNTPERGCEPGAANRK